MLLLKTVLLCDHCCYLFCGNDTLRRVNMSILGNDNLHDLTSQAHYTLRIDMEDFEDNTRYAVYSNFTVASEGDKYKFSVGAYNGTAGN